MQARRRNRTGQGTARPAPGTTKHGQSPRRWALLLCAVLFLAALRMGTLAACAARTAPEGCSLRQGSGQALCFPLDTAAWRISDPYGWREDPFTREEQFHQGIDLACAEGTPVRAAADGVVTSARRSASYGNVLRLCHADGLETLYAHLQYAYVRPGEVVRAGQIVGTAGQTGRATGPHLHVELLRGGVRCAPDMALGLL